MAITFEKKINFKYYLTVFLLVLFILSGLFFLFKYFIEGFILEAPLEEPEETKIEINFEVLKNPAIQGLAPFEEIEPFEEEVGRDNPFLAY